MLPLIFKALGLAMGVAVLVLSLLDKIDNRTGLILLSLGLASLGMALF